MSPGEDGTNVFDEGSTPDSDPVEDFLSRLQERPMREDLEPVRERVKQWEPSTGWPPITQVVGSNGKGSFVHYLTRLLTNRGHRVVSYTSPHLHHPRERIAVNGEPVSEDRFAELLVALTAPVRTSYTPFECLLLMTLLVVREEDPDDLVLEAGMGGRWDATSALPADVTVLTGLEKEHTRFLGENLVEILEEKICQVPEHSTLVIPPLPEPCMKIVDDLQQRRSLEVIRVSGSEGDVDDLLREMAARAVTLLYPDARKPTAKERESLPKPPGRKERCVVQGRVVYFDVAHTPGAVRSLFDHLRGQDVNNPWMVFGCLEGKRHEEMVGVIQQHVGTSRLVLTEPPSPRALNLDTLYESWTGNGPHRDPDCVSAAKWVLDRSEPNDTILVVGSFPLVGRIREIWL